MNWQTYHAKNNEVERGWVHVDGTDQILGRLSARLAVILQGKNKPQYTPHHDVGDFVIVTNAAKIRITGNKLDQKMAMNYTGYPSGLKKRSYRWMMEHRPEELLRLSVRRMLPKNKLAYQMINKLKIYRGAEHPHASQQPQAIEV